MLKKYVIVVRDEIITNKPSTDETFRTLDCYYESPIFYAEGTWQSLDKALDQFYHYFKHFISWSAQLVEVL